jgi:CRP-like cAMP-binding protein
MIKTETQQNEDVCAAEDSCLAAKLNKLAPLTESQVKLLAALEDDQEIVDAGTTLIEQDSPMDELFVLKKGWALASRAGHDGVRHVPTVFHPGDVIGLCDIPFAATPNAITAATRLTICRFPRSRLKDVFRQSPRLSGLILALGMIEQSILNDRIVISRRTEGHLRLVLFLLQTMSRLRLMEPMLDNQFYCPLSQEQIGAATGLSAVHVSRSISKLVDGQLIERPRKFFKLSDEAALEGLVGYVNRYSALDLSWLPQGD